MDLQINGRRALVTGASSGLGLGAAAALAKEGVSLYLVSRSSEKLEAARAAIHRETPDAVVGIGTIPLDDEGAATQAARDATSFLGGIDIVIANSGGPPSGGYTDVDAHELRTALERNFIAMAELVRQSTPGMVEQGWGRVVAITSVTVRMPSATLILSNAARTALTAYLKTAATAVAQFGVTINTIQPGLHLTDRLKALHGDPTKLGSSIPMGRVGDPWEFGRVIAFLCSESASFITGVALPVDGGSFPGLQ